MAITKTPMTETISSENYCELKEKHNNSLDSKEETLQHVNIHTCRLRAKTDTPVEVRQSCFCPWRQMASSVCTTMDHAVTVTDSEQFLCNHYWEYNRCQKKWFLLQLKIDLECWASFMTQKSLKTWMRMCHFERVISKMFFFVTGEIGLASFHPQKGCFLSGSCTARAVEEGTTVMWLLTTALSVKINKMSLYLQQPITACQIFNQPISTQYRICDLSWCHTSPEQTDKSTCPDDFGSCCCLYTEILFIYLTVD